MAQKPENDKIQFDSQVEAAKEIDFWGIPLLAYTLTLVTPDGFSLRLTMTATNRPGRAAWRPAIALGGLPGSLVRLFPTAHE